MKVRRWWRRLLGKPEFTIPEMVAAGWTFRYMGRNASLVRHSYGEPYYPRAHYVFEVDGARRLIAVDDRLKLVGGTTSIVATPTVR